MYYMQITWIDRTQSGLSSIAILAGVIVAIVNLVDWLLRERHKKQLLQFLEDCWLWLSDQRMGKFLDAFRRYNLQLTIGIIAWLFAVIAMSFLMMGQVSKITNHTTVICTVILLLAILLYICLRLLPAIITWALATPQYENAILRLYGVSILFFTPIIIMNIYAIWLLPDMHYKELQHFLPSFDENWPLWFSVMILYSVGFVSSVLFMLLGLWQMIVWLLFALFWCVQFLPIRIVEYPKGPIMALSGLLIAIGAVVKIFMKGSPQ
jgi:hypothetical protein